MMLVHLSLSALKRERPSEYVVRFVLGGGATVATGLLSKMFGPAVGGLFLALPAIFCASATLIESHERRRKDHAGLKGHRRGQMAAALDAAGAALGSMGLFVFAALFFLLIENSAPLAFTAASIGWAVISVCSWWLRRLLRVTHRSRAIMDPARPT